VNERFEFDARRILVVDDNPVILKALSMALTNRGYWVFTAIDSGEAFNIARRERIDLILLDIFFPPDAAQTGNSWDGFLIMQWFQRIGVVEGVPIIIISGADPKKYKDRCLQAGAVAFFPKPIDVPQLLAAIQDILKTAPSHPASEPALAMSR